MITCQECEAEFEVVHEILAEVEYCPFCGERLVYDSPEDWDETSLDDE
jgi:hypothetical protein